MSLENVRKQIQGEYTRVSRTTKSGKRITIVTRYPQESTLEEMDRERLQETEESFGHSMSWLKAHGFNENSNPDDFLHE